ncbi:MAG: 13E12 repeat family protein, partial [Actinomycetia bacterium]|nr:13E12 repeat family protein [Actinomycetes bacterium]
MAAVLRLPGIVDDDALERAISVKRSLASMESDQYLYLLEYLDECAADPQIVRLCGGERVHPYGGDGTPDIPEFAVCEVAAALGMANRSASRLVADMLDLRHRLPLLFQCLAHGDVQAWRVRNVAAATRELSVEQVGEVDVRLSRAGIDGLPVIARMSRSRVERVVDQFRCTDDADATEKTRERNLEDRHVRFGDGGEGVEEISAVVSAADGRRLDARVDQIAGWLGEVDAASGAESRSKDVRRSVALVMLGEPDQVADLEDQVTALRTGHPEPTDDEQSTAGQPADEPSVAAEPC